MGGIALCYDAAARAVALPHCRRCAQREGRKREEGLEDGRQETVGNSVSIRKIHGVSTKNGFFFPDTLNLT